MGDKNAPLLAVLQVLKKYNLKGTEELLRKEAQLLDIPTLESQSDQDISNVLAAYQSEGDPQMYTTAYENLRKFIESSLDIYKHELSVVLYPVLVHMFMEFMSNGHEENAKVLLEQFGPEQEEFYQEDLRRFSQITSKHQLANNEIANIFNSNKFVIQVSRDTSSLLKRHLHEQKSLSVVSNIVNNRIQLELYEGGARNRKQVLATLGALMGEGSKQENRTKVYYGLLKEPDIQILSIPEDDEEPEETSDKPKKKKNKKDSLFSKKTKSDPNAPPLDRMPLPDLKEVDKLEKARGQREASKRVALGPDSLPSICFYTLLNSLHTVTCAEICDDSSYLAVGFNNSSIKVWSLTPNKLKIMKPVDKLADIDREAVDVLVRMMDEKIADVSRTLMGHSGPIYRVSFDPFKTLLISCSEDTTIRLWSIQTWKCLVCYRGHMYPVWDIKFSPHGHYFATASHDKTARLWATDHHQALRIFSGHLADVDCVQFHPNSNYIATGSSDRTVRLWDCVTGNQVRIMTGHKSTINILCFSMCGRYLASGCGGGQILIWDLSQGHLVAEFANHSSPVHSLVFSRDGAILASGALDCTLKLWDFNLLTEEMSNEETNTSQNPEVKTGDHYLLRSFPTKNSPIVSLHFTRRNLLLAVGMYEYSQ